MIDIERLVDTYLTMKEYVPHKDRQEAADNLISLLVDSLSDSEISEISGTDSFLRKAAASYSIVELSHDGDDASDDMYNDHNQ